MPGVVDTSLSGDRGVSGMSHAESGRDAGETAALAEFVSTTTAADVPASAFEDARTAIRDYLGVAVYGAHHGVGERIAAHVEATMPGDDATVLARGTASPTGAALANGTFGHAVDYDDTFESVVIHPTSPVFAAALAAVEHAGGTAEDLLTAYVVGCEAAFRVGHATFPSHYDNGWHSTGTAGSFGAAAAAAAACSLDTAATRRAFGVVASGASSLKKNFGTMTKPLHAGHAAETGLRAAMLADRGWTADRNALEGDLGYGSVMTPDEDGYDPSAVLDGLGEPDPWAVADIGFKPYPSGVITHAAMDALRDLVREHDLTPATTERVVVTLEEAADEMLIHAEAEDELEAKFSIEFCLAAILREGEAGVREFTDEYVQAPATRAAMALVERDFEADLFGDEFAGYGARVVVETGEGRLENAVRHAPGSPNNPVSEARLAAKFEAAAGAVYDDDAVAALRAAVEGLGQETSLADLRAAT